MDERNTELLQAIQAMLDPMKERLDGIDGRFDAIDSRLDGLEGEIRKTNLIIENELRPNIQKLVDGYIGLVDRLWHLPDDMDELKEKVSILEFIQDAMLKERQKI